MKISTAAEVPYKHVQCITSKAICFAMHQLYWNHVCKIFNGWLIVVFGKLVYPILSLYLKIVIIFFKNVSYLETAIPNYLACKTQYFIKRTLRIK